MEGGEGVEKQEGGKVSEVTGAHAVAMHDFVRFEVVATAQYSDLKYL